MVKFGYNLRKDAWSWVVIAKDKNNLWGLDWRNEVAHMSDDLLKKIEKVSFSRAQKIVEEYIKNSPRKVFKNKVLHFEKQALEKSWSGVEKKYFKTLSKVMGKPIFTNSFNCYFTTGLMCPYKEGENWFMVSMWHSIPASITTICHEIMHFQFLRYYKGYLKKKGLKNDQIEDLKESLTFLLNEPEFDKIILCQDNGYPDHLELRKKLKNIWSKDGDFQKLIDEAVRLILK